MFATIALVVVGGIAALLGFAATKSDSFRIQRSISINAPPERIYPLIHDFHRWREWSPWEKIDADLQRSYSGPPSGTGAVYEWAGKKAGAGRMEITDSSPPSSLAIQLDFTRPFRASNSLEFILTPQGGVTTVDWVMVGANRYLNKVMSSVINMDKMIGKDFEAGLVNLKTASESASAEMNPPAV